VAVALIFLVSIGVVQELLAWNKSVFISTLLMTIVMIFYARHTLGSAKRIGAEKDALDAVRKWLGENDAEVSGDYSNFSSPDCTDLLFNTTRFFEEQVNAPEFSTTFVADYFRQLGRRIAAITLLRRTENVVYVKPDDHLFCFYSGVERMIRPIVNGGTKLMLLGFFGTLVGILLIGIGMRFALPNVCLA